MYYIDNPETEPAYNLAFEEYFCKKRGAAYFILWRNAPSVIIGRYQNTLAEVNLAYCEQNRVAIVRRNSGGGAVFHDLGNLNFSLIVDCAPGERPDFAPYAGLVAAALGDLGLDARVSGRNDIEAGGKKISGNAQYLREGRLLHHGTLLFDVDMQRLGQALAVDAEKIRSKGVSSVRARVANIRALLPRRMDVLSFKQALAAAVLARRPDIVPYAPDADELAAIRSLAEKKYRSWEWNFGASPQADCSFSRRFPAGRLEVYVSLDKGRIRALRLYGDFFAAAELTPLLNGMTGLPFARPALAAYLAGQDIPIYGIGADELLACCFGD